MQIRLLAKIYCNPQINIRDTFPVNFGHEQHSENFELLAEVEQGNTLPFCFSFHTINIICKKKMYINKLGVFKEKNA